MDRARFEHLLSRSATRRGLLAGGSAVGLSAAISRPGRATRPVAQTGTPGASPFASPVASPTLGANPFTLGVASGDPLPAGVVLWTRLAVAPTGGGGMDPVPYAVRWELAADDAFRQVVQIGTAVAAPTLGHSVHVDVTGLQPATVYYYRFMVGGEESPVGRTKTAPALGATVDRLRFALASCSHYEHGYFTAYRDLAAQDLDLVVHVGDYLYEYPAGEEYRPAGYEPVREHVGGETVSLDDYRNRHAQYKTDPDLQAAHAAFAWVATWDDHETENNYAGEVSEDGDPVAGFLARRAAAYQAYYEHMPLRASSFPIGPDMQLYRRLTYGTLAELQVLDGRQYRSDQPCGDGVGVRCPEVLDPNQTMTGPDQERWLLQGLDASPATWNVIAQQTMMAQLDTEPEAPLAVNLDQWDGYPAARNRILSHVMSRGTSNPVVLTGDIHSAWVNDLKADFADPASPTVGTELVCTSVTADNPFAEQLGQLRQVNPHIAFYDGNHGYTVCELTPERWQADFRAVADVTIEGAPVETVAAFVIEAGAAGAKPA
jgi:alkaline phosphatase D